MACLKKPTLADLVRNYLQTVEDAKLEYERADALLVEIARKWRATHKNLLESGKFVEIDGVKYELIDQFRGQVKVWGHGSVRKWAIEPVKKSKAA